MRTTLLDLEAINNSFPKFNSWCRGNSGNVGPVNISSASRSYGSEKFVLHSASSSVCIGSHFVAVVTCVCSKWLNLNAGHFAMKSKFIKLFPRVSIAVDIGLQKVVRFRFVLQAMRRAKGRNLKKKERRLLWTLHIRFVYRVCVLQIKSKIRWQMWTAIHIKRYVSAVLSLFICIFQVMFAFTNALAWLIAWIPGISD